MTAIAATLAAAVAVQAAPAASFAPPLDRPIRVVTEAVRVDSGVTRRFVSAKRVTFRRDGGGFGAEVVIEPGEPGGAEDDPMAQFAMGIGGLAGRTVLIRLDAQGRVIGVADQAAVWRSLIDGFAALASSGPAAADRARADRMRAVVGSLGKLPPERQRAMLGSLISPLVAADIVTEGAGPPRAVRVPAASAFGLAQLDGLRAVRADRGQLEVSVSATGSISVKTPDGMAAGQMTLEALRRVDPRTGLLVSSEEAVRTVLPDGSLASERLTMTRIER